MVQGLAEVAVHGLGQHRWVKVLAHLHRYVVLVLDVLAVVEAQNAAQMDLERVDAELKLALHFVHKLELYVLALVVEKRDERPARRRAQ